MNANYGRRLAGAVAIPSRPAANGTPCVADRKPAPAAINGMPAATAKPPKPAINGTATNANPGPAGTGNAKPKPKFKPWNLKWGGARIGRLPDGATKTLTYNAATGWGGTMTVSGCDVTFTVTGRHSEIAAVHKLHKCYIRWLAAQQPPTPAPEPSPGSAT